MKKIISIVLALCCAAPAQIGGGQINNPTSSSTLFSGSPWYSVFTAGATGNTKVITDAAITAGQPTLTSATASFTAADVGKAVWIQGAGASSGYLAVYPTYTSGGSITGAASTTCLLTAFNNTGTAIAGTVGLTGVNTIASGTQIVLTNAGSAAATAAPTSATLGNGTATCSGTATISTTLVFLPLVTTISAFVNSTTVTLSANATTTVSGALANYGTDDTTAIQNAINTAQTNRYALFFPCGTYYLSAALTITSALNVTGQNQNCVILTGVQNKQNDLVDITSGNVSWQNITTNSNALPAILNTANTFEGIKMTSTTTVPLSNFLFDYDTMKNASDFCLTWGQATSSAVQNFTLQNSTITGCGGPSVGGITNGATMGAVTGLSFINNTIGTYGTPTILTTQAQVELYVSNNVAGSTWLNVKVAGNTLLYPCLQPNNTVQQESDGVVVSDGGTTALISNVVVSNNIIGGTPAAVCTNTHGVELWGADLAEVTANTIWDNYNAVLTQANNSNTPVHVSVTGNTINAGAQGIIQGPGFIKGSITGNWVSAATTILTSSSDVSVTGNTLSGVVNIKCSETSCANVNYGNNTIVTPSGVTAAIAIPSGTFTGLGIQNNRINLGSSGQFGFNVPSATVTGVISGNTVTGSTHYATGVPTTLRMTGLAGVTGSIGGGALAQGACTSGTVTIDSATQAVASGATINVTPVTLSAPGAAFSFTGQLTGSNIITVNVCAIAAGTPTATTYNVTL